MNSKLKPGDLVYLVNDPKALRIGIYLGPGGSAWSVEKSVCWVYWFKYGKKLWSYEKDTKKFSEK